MGKSQAVFRGRKREKTPSMSRFAMSWRFSSSAYLRLGKSIGEGVDNSRDAVLVCHVFRSLLILVPRGSPVNSFFHG